MLEEISFCFLSLSLAIAVTTCTYSVSEGDLQVLQLQLGPMLPKPNLLPCGRPHVVRVQLWLDKQAGLEVESSLGPSSHPLWDSAVLEGDDLQLANLKFIIKTSTRTDLWRRDEMPEDEGQVLDLCATPHSRRKGATGYTSTGQLGQQGEVLVERATKLDDNTWLCLSFSMTQNASLRPLHTASMACCAI